MAALAIYQGVQMRSVSTAERGGYLPLFLWAALNAVVCAGAAVRLWTYRPRAEGGREQVAPIKLLVLTVGGVLGLTTFFCLGGLYVFYNEDWRTLVAKGRSAWMQWQAWVPVVLGIAGLVVMFLSLLAVRSEERHNPTLRRLI
jgi:hypothetical protein